MDTRDIYKLVRELSEERDELGRKLSRTVTLKYERKYGEMFLTYLNINDDDRRERIAVDSVFASIVEAYNKE